MNYKKFTYNRLAKTLTIVCIENNYVKKQMRYLKRANDFELQMEDNELYTIYFTKTKHITVKHKKFKYSCATRYLDCNFDLDTYSQIFSNDCIRNVRALNVLNFVEQMPTTGNVIYLSTRPSPIFYLDVEYIL